MRIDMWPLDYFMDWLGVKTIEEVVLWLKEHNVKTYGDGLYVNSIEFELAYDKPAIIGLIERFGKNWASKYIVTMRSIHIDFNDSARVKQMSQLIKDLYEGKTISAEQVFNTKTHVTGFPLRAENKDEVISFLFQTMKGKAIGQDTDVCKFKKLFSNEPLDSELQIVWLYSASDLAYFFEKLIEIDFLSISTQYNSKIKRHKIFVDEFAQPFANLKVAKQSYLQRKNNLPINYLFFDDLLKKYKPT